MICGFGRIGATWGSETFDLKPDMMTRAKALSGAYLPISALLIADPIYRAMLDQADKHGLFGHGHTHAAHPVCAAVAIEALKIYDERDIVGHVGRIAGRFQGGLRAFADHPLVGEIRGVELMAAIELVADTETKQPFDASARTGASVAATAEARGLIVRALGDVLVFSPPLVIERTDIDELLVIVGDALDAVWKSLEDSQSAETG